MEELKYTDLSQYETELQFNTNEHLILYSRLLNHYTTFFRDTFMYCSIEKILLPYVTSLHHKEIRVWSVGCSTGQEPYSLAITLYEYMNRYKKGQSFHIVATDISENEITAAKQGIYEYRDIENLTIRQYKEYLTPLGDRYQISSLLRNFIDFECADLLDQNKKRSISHIFGTYDFIVCSNILYYYDPIYQTKILQNILKYLKPDGFLITTEAESFIIKKTTDLVPIPHLRYIFQKKEGTFQ